MRIVQPENTNNILDKPIVRYVRVVHIRVPALHLVYLVRQVNIRQVAQILVVHVQPANMRVLLEVVLAPLVLLEDMRRMVRLHVFYVKQVGINQIQDNHHVYNAQ